MCGERAAETAEVVFFEPVAVRRHGLLPGGRAVAFLQAVDDGEVAHGEYALDCENAVEPQPPFGVVPCGVELRRGDQHPGGKGVRLLLAPLLRLWGVVGVAVLVVHQQVPDLVTEREKLALAGNRLAVVDRDAA